MKTKSIFSIGLEFQALQDLIDSPTYDEETGELLDESTLTELFNELKVDTYTKLDSTMFIIKEKQASADTIATEIKRLQARKKAFENGADRLKQRLFEFIQLQDDKKFKTDLHSFSIRKSETLEITDDKTVPSDYIEFTKKINKVELKKDIKSGKIEATDGYFIQRNETLGVR